MFQISLLSPLKRNCVNHHHKLRGTDRAAKKEALLNYWVRAGKIPALKRVLMRKVTVRPAMRKARLFPWMFMWYLSKPVRTCALIGSTVVSAFPEHWGLGGKPRRMQLRLARAGQSSLCQVSQKGAAVFIWSFCVSLGDLRFPPE